MNIRDKQQVKKVFKDLFLVFIGIFCAGLGLEGFLLPNGFIDGGATGISLLVTELTGVPLPILIVLINIPFLAIGYTQISPQFAFRSAGAIAGLALWITFFHYPVLTQEKLLISVFGGFFLGAGIGFSIRGGCVIDGTEILAISIGKKTGLTVGDVILIINIFIFGAAAFLLDVNTSLYSLLTYLAASKTIDFIIHGIEEYIGVTIISEKNESVRKNIIKKVGAGVTVYKGKKGFSDTEIDIIYTITTRLETSKLKSEILAIDPYAFIIESAVNNAEGGMIKKRALH